MQTFFPFTWGDNPLSLRSRKIIFGLLCATLVLLAFYLRASGLFRGLGGTQGTLFHPDEAKQVLALFHFIGGDYVRYYGSLFYDGYPYGLNHLDEYLLRPLLFCLGSETPDQQALYYYARLLRVVYGMAVLLIGGTIVYRLTQKKTAVLLALLFLAIAPSAITVTHFATGDIGVDLFCALCFLFLLLYQEQAYTCKRQKMLWLFACGVTVGAAFSAKYNGLLIGMVPAMLLCLELLEHKNFRLFITSSVVLTGGSFLGLLIFTPNLVLDPLTTISNMLANFAFIKNYNVPADILAKSWLEKAALGLRLNSGYIIASLGYTVFLASLAGVLLTGREYLAVFSTPNNQHGWSKFSGTATTNNERRSVSPARHDFQLNPKSSPQIMFLLALSLFPALSLLIALSGKYVVQPFHFSYLLLPLIIISSVLFSTLLSSRNTLFKVCGTLCILLAVVEFGRTSLQENFFWRLEDNASIAQQLPASIYDREAFYTHPSGVIRSLFLEPAGNSVFRNSRLTAKGPDASLWNTLQVAPLPLATNPVSSEWIFLNGPTFPRNERTLALHGTNYGTTLKKYVVLPTGKNIPALGIRCGSYATRVAITFGQTSTAVQLEAHEQKTIVLQPKKWRTSGSSGPGNQEVRIILLEISVPHNDAWVTLLSSREEQKLFNIFGGGQDGQLSVPRPVPAELKQQYFSALSRIRYLEFLQPWQVAAGKSIPMWGVALPAGRYTLIAEIDGLTDASKIAIEFEDARGRLYRQQKQSFEIQKGVQRIKYSFTKPFAPYQFRFVLSGLKGTSQMLSLKLYPDYVKLADDFDRWRSTGIEPDWATRFTQQTD